MKKMFMLAALILFIGVSLMVQDCVALNNANAKGPSFKSLVDYKESTDSLCNLMRKLYNEYPLDSIWESNVYNQYLHYRNAAVDSIYDSPEFELYIIHTEELLDSISRWDESFMDTVGETDAYLEYADCYEKAIRWFDSFVYCCYY